MSTQFQQSYYVQKIHCKKKDNRKFSKSFIDDIFEVYKLFGPKAVLFLSNVDKARVPLGLIAVSLQVPLLMHTEYKVKLMDHDCRWPTAQVNPIGVWYMRS